MVRGSAPLVIAYEPVANQDCAQLDRKLVPPGEGKCEYDVYGKTTAGAVSLNLGLGAKSTIELLAGRIAPDQALSPSQIRYLREIAGSRAAGSDGSRQRARQAVVAESFYTIKFDRAQ